jgi:hypothetical protein
MTINRSWTLASRPAGPVTAQHFRLAQAAYPQPVLEDGQLHVRNRLFAVAPTIRNWLNGPERSYRGSVPVGGVIPGIAGVEVLASRHPDYRVGERLVAMSRWETFSLLAPDRAAVPIVRVPDGMSLEDALGRFSLNMLTAYFGLVEVGKVRAGETVVVSGAAGSVGSAACQIARILGCHVVAIAGGPAKCAWLREECGVAATIDYKAEDVGSRLAALCPSGIDLFFDNVGGEILQAAIDNIAPHGRVALCGQISAYDGTAPAPGPRDMMTLVYGRVRMEGFIVGDFLDRIDTARAQLADWYDRGALTARIDLRRGFQSLPDALVDLFRGANRGTLLVAAQ